MKVQHVVSQDQLDRLLGQLDWSHGFIREAHALNQGYVERNGLGTVAPDAGASVKLLFTFPDPAYPGLELIFSDTTRVFFDLRCDLDPVGHVSARNGRVELHLHGGNSSGIEARSLEYILLDSTCWGPQSRYAEEDR